MRSGGHVRKTVTYQLQLCHVLHPVHICRHCLFQLLATVVTSLQLTRVQRNMMKNASKNGSSSSASIPASSAEANKEPDIKFALKVAVSLGAGMVFGFAAEKGRVTVPETIRNQMLMSQFTMLKMFLSAVAAGVTGFVVIAVFPATRSQLRGARNSFRNCVHSKHIGIFAAGGAILGMGMTLAGSCPGMVMLQAGNGTQHALFTLAGCFVGALLYGALEPFIISSITHKRARTSHDTWLHHRLGLPYANVAVVFALLLVAVVGVAEYLVPWQTEVPVSSAGVHLLQQRSWSPIWAGLLMGCTQIPVLFTVGDSLGSSSSYCTAISMATKAVGADRSLPYFARFCRGIGNWWQVAYWLGGAAGACLSAHLSSSWGESTNSGTAWMSLVGGALLLFGARLASGCTSGHGLSGMALLATTSFVTVPAMFVGGIGLAMAMKT